jgi:signal transduction histidine kinase
MRTSTGLSLDARVADNGCVRARPSVQALRLTALCAAVTVVVAVTPRLWFTDRLTLHVALDTAVGLTALFTALLVLGRLRAELRLDWLALLAGLLVLGGGSLPFSAIPTAIGNGRALYFGVWAPLGVGLVGAALLAVAGALPETPLRRRRRWIAVAFVTSFALLLVVAATVEALRPILVHSIPPTTTGRPHAFSGSAPTLAMYAAGAALLGFAGLKFVGKGERDGDAFAAWVGAACILSAFARLQYVIFPSAYPHWFFLGDLFRLSGYLMLAVGGVRELSGYWRRLAGVAVLEERRRIARELHDGLAQELAYIAAEADGGLALAAQRALDESRRAIAALTRPVDEPVAQAIAQAAEEVAGRWGARVQLVLAEAADVAPEVREELIRIVREAVANAARHAGTGRVLVEVGGGGRLRLRVADDGCGFDPAAPHAGHGIVSMRERAQALGATLSVRSGPDAGTEVEVLLA